MQKEKKILQKEKEKIRNTLQTVFVQMQQQQNEALLLAKNMLIPLHKKKRKPTHTRTQI